MTREEAIRYYDYINRTEDYGSKQAMAARIALAALRPVSREQVEKMRGEWNYSHTTEIDHFTVVKCSKCGHEAFAMAIHVKDGNFALTAALP